MTSLTLTLIEGDAIRGWVGSRVRNWKGWIESYPVDNSSDFCGGKAYAAMARIDFAGDNSFTTGQIRGSPSLIIFAQLVTAGTMSVIKRLTVGNRFRPRFRSGSRSHCINIGYQGLQLVSGQILPLVL